MVIADDDYLNIVVANVKSFDANMGDVVELGVSKEDTAFIERSMANTSFTRVIRKVPTVITSSRIPRCWKYHKLGHKKNSCILVRIKKTISKRICYHCRIKGHELRNCPFLQNKYQ